MARIRTLVALAALVFLAACGGAQAAGEPIESAAVAEEAVPESVLTGTFATSDGAELDLAQFQGQDVVLWFWAPW